MTTSDRDYIIAFSYLGKIGPARFTKLRSVFSTLKEAWNANAESLREAGLPQDAVDELLAVREKLDFNSIFSRFEREKISVVTIDDEAYPEQLREIHYAPFILYYRGAWPSDWSSVFGIVGTRKPSAYGKLVTPVFAQGLARSGVIVASGLALGIDSLTHEGVLSAGGVTVAIIGSGVDEPSIYPPGNKLLARRIIEGGGAIISEYPPGMTARKQHFPARNRIIAGLSRGVMVVEAQARSGALITAYCALEQNRDVFAVPGPITSPLSDGPNDLLKRGAVVVTDIPDILNFYGYSSDSVSEKKTVAFASDIERDIYGFLSTEPQHVDSVTEALALDSATVTSTLLIMEMNGLVRNVGFMQYVRAV